MAALPTTPTPTDIGKYRIRGVLGRGGMGVVYDAGDDERRVAVKTVLGTKNKFVHAVRREIHALARLRHPGVVAIVDEGTHEGAPWYAMEFVDGLTLRGWARALALRHTAAGKAPGGDDEGAPGGEAFVDAVCTGLGTEGATVTHAGGLMAPIAGTESSREETTGRRGQHTGLPLPAEALPEVLVVARRLCLTLEYLHSRGLVHRDLKPDNVIVKEGGRPVVVDFGLVFHATGVVGRESIEELALLGAGTASYMAPEQVRGDGVDARADLYSLGAILFELVTGHTPFEGNSSLAVLNQHLNGETPSLAAASPWVPPALDALVTSLLEKKAQDRPANAALVATRLADIARDVAGADAAGDAVGADDGDGGYATPPRPFLYRPALAGRAAVLDALDDRLARLDKRGDRGGVVLLVGPSGIGKTRVALEAARRAAGDGALVLAGEASARGARPLAPLRKVLQVVSEKCTVGGAQKTTTLVGQNAKIFAAYEPSFVVVPGFELFPDPEPLPAPEARRRLLASLRTTLDNLAQEQPLLVIIDDLQWADELTLAFLDHLAASEDADAPFIVLATVRAEEGEEVVEALGDHPRSSVLRLDRLTEDAVREMIDGALGVAAPDGLVQLVEERAGGVPFWVGEVLHAGVLAHLLERDEAGAWCTRDARAAALPSAPAEILGLRLSAVGDDARAVLDAAAVLGRGAQPGVVQEVSGIDELRALEAMSELRAEQILDDDPDEGVRFTHDKLAEAAYALLDGERRAALHGRAAAVLEARAPAGSGSGADGGGSVRAPSDLRPALDGPALAEQLAWHHENAGAAARAVEYWLVAGDGSRRLSALKDAERCYERACALLEKLGDVAGLAKTLMKLGLVHAAVFDSAGAQRSYQRAFSLWAELEGTAAGLSAQPPTARIRVTNQPKSLDPARAYDSDSLFVQAQLFEGLVELDVDANVLPAAASSWEISADGRTWLFHIRDNARWSDGTPLRAADFELAWKRVLDPRLRSPVAQLLYVLDNGRAYHEGSITDPHLVGVRATGQKTLEVKLGAPSAYLLNLLSHPCTFPIPAKTFFEHGHRWTAPGVMVSNGAFVLEERERLLVRLRRNPLFTGRAEGNIAEIEVNAYRNYGETLEAFDQGHLDILDMIAADADVLASARARTKAGTGELRFLPLHSTQYLVLRADRPPLDDERVRKALALLIDRDALAAKLAGTSHLVARGGFIATGVAGHTPSLALRFDPERAAALFAEAGFQTPGDLPPLVWLHTHGLGDTTLLELVRDAWAAFGVRITMREVDWNDYERALRDDPPHVVLGGWIADYPDPDTFLRAVFHSVEGAEKIGWSDPRFDQLVEEASRTADPRAREELYGVADHMLVADKAVVVPLSYGQNPVLLRKSVRAFPGAGSYLRPMKNVVVDEGTS